MANTTNIEIIVSTKQAQTNLNSLKTTTDKAKKATSEASDQARKYGKELQELGKAVRLVDGPLGGVASRVQTLSAIVSQGNLRIAALTLGFSGLILVGRSVVNVVANIERELDQLSNILEITGRNAETSAAQLDKFAIAFGEATLTSREEVLASQKILATFSNIATKDFSRLIEIAQGLSNTFGGSLTSNVQKLARAFDSPGQAAGSLERQMGKLTKGQREYLKSLEESGRIGEAQAFLFGELGRFSEFATAGTSGLAGAIDTLGERTRRLVEAFGDASGLTSALTGLVNSLSGGIELLIDNISVVSGLIVAASLPALAGLINLVGGLTGAMSAAAGGAAVLAVALKSAFPLAAIAGMVTLIIEYFDEIHVAAISLGGGVAKVANTIGEYAGVIGDVVSAVFSDIGKIFEAYRKDIAALLNDPLNAKNLNLTATRGAIADAFTLGFKEAYNNAKADIAEFNKTIDASVNDLIDDIVGGRNLPDGPRSSPRRAGGRESLLGPLITPEEMADFQKAWGEVTSDLAQAVEDQEKLTAAAYEGLEAEEEVSKELKIQSELRKLIKQLETDKIKLTKEQKAELERQVRALENGKSRHKEIIDLQKEQVKEAERLADTLENGIADALEQALLGNGKGAVRSFFAFVQGELTRGLAQNLARGILGTATQNAGQISSLLGINGARGGPRASGGSGLGSLSSISSLFSGSGLDGSIIPGFAAPLVDQIGLDLFGIGRSVAGPFTGAAPFTEGVTGGLSGSFTGGSALAGLAGSFLGDAVFGGGGYSSIGSSLGGIGGTVAGSAIGTSMGTILGFAGGPAGAIIGAGLGSFLGSGLGSLFGGSTPNPAATAGITDIYNSGNFGSVDLQAKHLSLQEAQNFSDTMQAVFSGLGAIGEFDLSALSDAVSGDGFAVAGGVENGMGFLTFGTDPNEQFARDNNLTATKYGAAITFDPQDQAAVDKALGDFTKLTILRLEELGEDVNDLLLDTLGNIETEGRNAEEVLNDIAFVLNFDKLGETEEQLSQFEQSFNNLIDLFDEAEETVIRLGLSEEKFNEQREKAMRELTDSYDDMVGQSITALADPKMLAISREYDRYLEQLDEARLLGADLNQVEILHKMNLIEIERQYGTQMQDTLDTLNSEMQDLESTFADLEALADSLDAAIRNIRLGDTSILSPEQKLVEARAEFESLLDLARGGDLDAAAELESLGNQVLQLSQAQNFSTTAFADDFALVEGGLQEIADLTDAQLSEIERQIRATEVQTDSILKGLDSLGDAFDQALKDVFGGGSSGGIGYIDTPRGVFSASNPNETVIANRSAIEAAGLMDETDALLTKYFGPADGVGGRSRAAESDPVAAARFIAEARAMGIPGFAKGGRLGMGRYALVGEEGPEIRASTSDTQIIPMQNRADVLDEIKQTNEILEANIRVLQAGFNELMMQNKRSMNIQEQQVSTARVAARKK